MRFQKIIFAFILSLVSVNLLAVTLTITSDPSDCEVTIRKLGDMNTIKLGKTPFITTFDEIATNYIDDTNFVLILNKDGYFPYEILLSDLITKDVDLAINLDIKQDFEQYRSIDAAISQLFTAQSHLRSKKYSEGLGILKDLETKQPYLSIISELIGSAYYMQRDLASALDAYTKAYRINPENRDAFTMKKYLEKSLGTKAQ